MKKIFVTLIFIAIASFICQIAPNFFMEDVYEDGEVRVIFNSNEITRNANKMPQKALVVDGKLMLSQDTVDILFDKWLYYDTNYDTIITTTDTNVAKLKLDEKKIKKNGEFFDIEVPAQKIDGEIYIPIEELQDIYDIQIVNNGKFVITEKSADMMTVTLKKNLILKAYKKNFSRTIEKVNAGDKINVFEYQNNPEWVLVRTSNGNLGYSKINSVEPKKIEAPIPAFEIPIPKVNLAWEYAENGTPDRSTQKKIKEIDVLSPTWIYLKNQNGELKNNIDVKYIEWAHKTGYAVWATFKNDGIGIDGTSKIVADMKKRESIISDLIKLCQTYNLDGINVDFEGMKKENVNEFSQFIRELSASLRRNNLRVSVDVTVPDGSDVWSLCYNRYEIAAAADYMVLMAYDQFPANSKVPGSTAELSWVESNLKKLIERDNINPEKIILGIPLYSRLWWVTNEQLQTSAITMTVAKEYLEKGAKWMEAEGQYYVEYSDGDTTYILWVEDEKAVEEKRKLIEKYNLAGAAYWRLGYEAKKFWEYK